MSIATQKIVERTLIWTASCALIVGTGLFAVAYLA
jgi:hypothetical protein